MQVSSPNDVKIYNLSAGKSLPEWLSDKQKRRMGRKDIEIRRRIELIQDFKMPVLSSNICLTSDGQYVLVSGIYKPRIRCYDLNQLALKFERCLDAEIVKFAVLSTDYSKLVFLHDDRHVEIHNQHGRYHRFRLPRIARDFVYNPFTCDCMFVGVGSDISRFNFEVGSFVPPIRCSERDTDVSACDINKHHGLFVAGTDDGIIDAWDSRAPGNAMTLNCRSGAGNASGHGDDTDFGISTLKFKDALRLGVGTSNGQVMLYDIRARGPFITKDHQYSQPITKIEFLQNTRNTNNAGNSFYAAEARDLVVSMDRKVIKIWDAADTSGNSDMPKDLNNAEEHPVLIDMAGKPFTSIEPGCGLNDLCIVPDSGMLFVANETQKVLVYFIPALGPAPKWCQALETITEELEETQPEVYDDYKFVTSDELTQLGLEHLIGTPLLRAYMHGYFIDLRLYKKAKSIAQPVTYEQFRQEKLQQAVERDRKEARVKILDALPTVNRELARKYARSGGQVALSALGAVVVDAEKVAEISTTETLTEDLADKKPLQKPANPLYDARFQAMFQNPDFEIDPNDELYQLHNAAVEHAKLNPARTNRKNLRIQNSSNAATQQGGKKERDDYSSSSDDDEEVADFYGGVGEKNAAEKSAASKSVSGKWLQALTSNVPVVSDETAAANNAKQRQELKKRAGEQRRQERKTERVQAYRHALDAGKSATLVAPPTSSANNESTLADTVNNAEGTGRAGGDMRRTFNVVTENTQGGRSITFKYREGGEQKDGAIQKRKLDVQRNKHARQQVGRKAARK